MPSSFVRAAAVTLAAVLCACATASSAAGPALPRTAAPPDRYRAEPAPRPGGVITLGSWQFPTTLSPYLGAQAAAVPIDEVLFSGLVGTDPALHRFGDLAVEAPTPANGGVRVVAGGMDVTYQLRPGLRWSDGQPITPDDVAFTFRVVGGIGLPGYDQIRSVERAGENGVVVHFRSLVPSYLDLFSAVLPRHRLEAVAPDRLAADPYWASPDVVSGPFAVQEVTGDRIALRRNPSYAAGRAEMPVLGHAAYADGLVFRAFPSRQAVLAAVKAGDIDVALDLTERELETVGRLLGVRTSLTPALAYEQISLNQSLPAGGVAPPWIGDPAVAEALDLALDRPGLERGPLRGASPLAASPLSPLVAWAADAGLPAPASDLQRAKRLLDEDGWAPGPDGIRVKDGRRLGFTLSTTAEQPLRATEQDIVIAGWRQLGADVRARNARAADLFAPYERGGLLALGQYDAALWAWITPPDPDAEYDILHSSRLPGPGPGGTNYSRCHDAGIDAALAAGRATLDQAARAEAYRAFQRAYVRARCELPLYRRLDIGVVSPRLRNFAPNPTQAGNTWNASDWWLASS